MSSNNRHTWGVSYGASPISIHETVVMWITNATTEFATAIAFLCNGNSVHVDDALMKGRVQDTADQ